MRIYSLLLLAVLCLTVAGTESKQHAIQTIRQQLAQAYRNPPPNFAGRETEIAALFTRLSADGEFSDATAEKLETRKANWNHQVKLGNELPVIFTRLRDMAHLIRAGRITDPEQRRRYDRALAFYCKQETQRPDMGRFLASCFTLPNLAAQIYFTLYPEWAPKGTMTPEREAAATGLRAVARQAFTQPLRNDVNDPYSPDQFRKHVWWVGGNFAYRPLFQAAAVVEDERLFDVIWTVMERSCDVVSHNTLDTAFWSEGICADGSGWGHGAQSYVFGYPSDGLSGVLRMMKQFQGTPWYRELSPEQWEAIAGFIEGAAWHQYRRQAGLSVHGRHNLVGLRNTAGMRIVSLVQSVNQLNPPAAIAQRLNRLADEMKKGDAELSGVRYFWNNDDLMVRGKSYYLLVNMISSRSYGPECVPNRHSARNYCLGDGSMLILRTGDEYDRAKGAMDFSLPPGVTGRSFAFPKVEIWSGFASKSDFAGGLGGETGCAGFIFERAPRREIKDPAFYGIRANKGYFMFRDVMVALGTGIVNRTPEVPGEIVTMVNQCEARGIPERDGDRWVLHDRIGYYVFPGYGGKLEMKTETRRTEWDQLDNRNIGNRELPDEVAIFSLAIRHGQRPAPKNRTDSYAYAVLPDGTTADAMRRFAAKPPVRIIANTTALQAVRHDGEELAQMVFYSPEAEYRDGHRQIKVDRPAILSVRSLPGKLLEITAADPLQTPEAGKLTVTLNGKTVELAFPRSPYCGKAVTRRIAE